MSGNQLLKKLAATNAPKPDKVPDDWMTIQQMVDSTGRSDNWVTKRIRTGIANGTVEQKSFRIRNILGIVRAIPHYRFK